MTKPTGKPPQKHSIGHDGLTTAERGFVYCAVQVMLENGGKLNASEAARRAGSTEKRAPFDGSKMMRKDSVKSAIQARHEQMLAKYDISSERILFELAKHAYTGMSKFVRVSDDGDGLYYDFSDATDEELDALAEVTVEEYTEGKGDDKRNVKRTKIKLIRKEALELLGRHKKLFVDRATLENPDGSPLVPPALNIEFIEPAKKEVSTTCPSGSSSPSTSSSDSSQPEQSLPQFSEI